MNEHYLKGWKQECAVVVVGTGAGEGDIHLCVTYEQICETDPAFLEPESPLVLCGMPAAILRQRRKQLSYSHVMLRRRNGNGREVSQKPPPGTRQTAIGVVRNLNLGRGSHQKKTGLIQLNVA